MCRRKDCFLCGECAYWESKMLMRWPGVGTEACQYACRHGAVNGYVSTALECADLAVVKTLARLKSFAGRHFRNSRNLPKSSFETVDSTIVNSRQQRPWSPRTASHISGAS